ncbi:hypothetical protein ACK3YL_20160 [Aeromonas caviae]|uniref:hypothetical protein n=1 Tax=Aeromonas sp. S19(2024) TaxID=3242892 RepID=UPI00352740C4
MEQKQALLSIEDITDEMLNKKMLQLGQNLARARKSRFNKAIQVSSEVGIGQTTYLAYENGARQRVLAWWLLAIEKVFAPRFGVDPAYLLGMKPESTPSQAPVWLMNKIAPHIQDAESILQIPIQDDSMAPNLVTGDIAVFERDENITQGGIYAIEYHNSDIQARWIVPGAVKGWQIKDSNGVLETIGDDDLPAIKVRGRYLFRMTK